METLLGFKLDFWDYATFLVLLVCVMTGLFFLVWLAGLPGRIAIARKHPDAEAVQIMGYAGFLAAVPWIQAFIWAFKPTDIVDIRRFPPQEARAIDDDIARLTGKTQPPAAKVAEPNKPEPEAKPAPGGHPPT
ncbi:MAG TPA: DUF3302 domain-containing protein [Verrucomicrobiae bacterium]|nr:DUF3302 domain-containing protein [Verrucomicrobiae bacterium]